MAKRPSLIKQATDILDSLEKFRESKHEEKEKKKAEAKALGLKGWNPARVDGIYSIVTKETYRREIFTFLEWTKQFECRYLNESVLHAGKYLQARIDRGDSAWTVQTVRSALRKLYQNQNLASEIKLPIRRKNEIKRSRGEKAMDKKFSPERNRDLVDFCKATGLRRHELKAVKAGDIYRDEDGTLRVDVHQGKGGRPRSVPVLKSLESRVLEISFGKDLDSQVIEKIPVRADIHGYRREYASSYYKELSGKDYNPKDKDTSAMLQVSFALGHNRLDVITRNYLG